MTPLHALFGTITPTGLVFERVEDTDRLPGGGPDPEQVWSETHLDPDLQASLDDVEF